MKTKTLIGIVMTIMLCTPLEVAAKYTRTSIYTAARAGDIDAVSKFVSKRVNQQTLDSLLGAAVTGQQLPIMELLVAKGADPNALTSYNSNLLHNAIMLDFHQAAYKLVELGADPNLYGYKRRERGVFIDWDWTPLMCAAFMGNENLIDILLEKGADPALKGRSTSDVDIETAADIAAYSGHLDILKTLLAAGAPLNRETIFKSVRGGHMKVLRYLLKEEKNIERLSRNQNTLLMEAAWWGREDMVRFLIRKGADVNYRAPNGETALLSVLSNPDRELKKQLSIVKLLIRNGASLREDFTIAQSLAQKHNKKPILDFLASLDQKRLRK